MFLYILLFILLFPICRVSCFRMGNCISSQQSEPESLEHPTEVRLFCNSKMRLNIIFFLQYCVLVPAARMAELLKAEELLVQSLRENSQLAELVVGVRKVNVTLLHRRGLQYDHRRVTVLLR